MAGEQRARFAHRLAAQIDSVHMHAGIERVSLYGRDCLLKISIRRQLIFRVYVRVAQHAQEGENHRKRPEREAPALFAPRRAAHIPRLFAPSASAVPPVIVFVCVIFIVSHGKTPLFQNLPHYTWRGEITQERSQNREVQEPQVPGRGCRGTASPCRNPARTR